MTTINSTKLTAQNKIPLSLINLEGILCTLQPPSWSSWEWKTSIFWYFYWGSKNIMLQHP